MFRFLRSGRIVVSETEPLPRKTWWVSLALLDRIRVDATRSIEDVAVGATLISFAVLEMGRSYPSGPVFWFRAVKTKSVLN